MYISKVIFAKIPCLVLVVVCFEITNLKAESDENQDDVEDPPQRATGGKVKSKMLEAPKDCRIKGHGTMPGESCTNNEDCCGLGAYKCMFVNKNKESKKCMPKLNAEETKGRAFDMQKPKTMAEKLKGRGMELANSKPSKPNQDEVMGRVHERKEEVKGRAIELSNRKGKKSSKLAEATKDCKSEGHGKLPGEPCRYNDDCCGLGVYKCMLVSNHAKSKKCMPKLNAEESKGRTFQMQKPILLAEEIKGRAFELKEPKSYVEEIKAKGRALLMQRNKKPRHSEEDEDEE